MERRKSKSEKGRKRMIEREPSRKEIGGRVFLLGLSAYQVEAGKREKTTRCVEWEREAFTNKMEHCVHSGRNVRMQNRVKGRKRETEISLQLYVNLSTP
jgi:hypothetical protein